VSEIVALAPREAAEAAGLERVLLSRVEDGQLIPEAAHNTELPEPVALAYPLEEGELLRRRRAAIVPERGAFPGYRVVAPVVIGGRTVAFFHGDDSPGGLASLGGVARGARPPAEPRDELAVALDALARFARGFALLYERAVLLRRLRTQHEELRQVASWADARSSELADSAIDLAHDREAPPARRPPAAPRVSALLTPRELDVLEQMARGVTNAEIARALVVSEGTVKFHVKNVLRKLNVSNRAEATAHYLRDSLRASP
jgi:DNA-binding CsgD family transcriptional regulator